MINQIKRQYHLYKAAKLEGKRDNPVLYTRWIYHLSQAEKHDTAAG